MTTALVKGYFWGLAFAAVDLFAHLLATEPGRPYWATLGGTTLWVLLAWLGCAVVFRVGCWHVGLWQRHIHLPGCWQCQRDGLGACDLRPGY
jgi:hypothetical protein